VRAETGYLIDFDSIPAEVADKAKILWVNYPNNPTGATADVDFYARAVDFCARHGILLASDNPYVDVTFDNYRAPSALEVPDAKETAIEFMSFSKTHNMAGWRLGAAVGNAEALKVLLKVKSNLDSGHFLAVFDAGITALDDTPADWIAWRNGVYQARRDRIMAALPHIGLSAATPLGSLYIWAKPAKISAETYVEEALSEALVSFAPGGAYGPGGADYVRLSLGVSDERLDQALERLKAWYSAKHG
jgi:LL-diaminopimelate aminotransferase